MNSISIHCPLCRGEADSRGNQTDHRLHDIDCPRCGKYSVDRVIYINEVEHATQVLPQERHLLAGFVREQNDCLGAHPQLLVENVDEIMGTLPRDPREKAEKLLLALHWFSDSFGTRLQIWNHEWQPRAYAKDADELIALLLFLEQEHLIWRQPTETPGLSFARVEMKGLREAERIRNAKMALEVTTMTLERDSATQDASNKVFVVHGHDDEMKQAVARVLTTLDLNPIILHEQPNQGKTLIEKFEQHSDVQFAAVLLSPDDIGFAKGDGAEKSRPRPRQNVILELGYFVGKLGRHCVFALKRTDDLDLPTDFAGVVYTPYDSGGKWRFELARELKAAKFKVDANKLL